MKPAPPVNDEENCALYADVEGNVIFGGRLGQYRYYDMDKVIRPVLDD